MNKELSDLFVTINGSTKAKCKMCEKDICGQTYNRKRHVQLVHQDLFYAIERKWRKVDRKAGKHSTKAECVLKWTPEKFESYLIRSVIEGGLPASHFSQPSFTDFHSALASDLGVSLDPDNIMKLVVDHSRKKKMELIDKLKEQQIFLKLDHTNMNERQFIGVSCHFLDMQLEEVVTFSLGVKRIINSQTDPAIKELILSKMNEYKIKKHQVSAIITDDTNNLISTSSLFSPDPECNTSNQNMDSNKIHNAILNQLTDLSDNFIMQHFKCPLLLFQDCLNKALNESGAQKYIDISKSLLKAACSVQQEAENLACLYRQKDQQPCWVNEFEILERVIESKEHYQVLHDRFPQLYVSDNDWNHMEELKSVLSHAHLFDKMVQEQSSTPGFFYFNWKSLIMTMEVSHRLYQSVPVATSFCKCLMDNMKECSKTLLKNKFFAAAIFVEPQYRSALSEQDITFAKNAFSDIALHIEEQKLRTLHFSTVRCGSETSNTLAELNDDSNILGSKSALQYVMQQKHLQRQGLDLDGITHQLQRYEFTISDCFKEMEGIHPQISLIESLWKYPEEARSIAQMLVALPTSRASVKRLLSAFNHPSNYSLDEDSMEAIMFLQWNGY